MDRGGLAAAVNADNARRLGIGHAPESCGNAGMIGPLAPADAVGRAAIALRKPLRNFRLGNVDQQREVRQQALTANTVERQDIVIAKPPAPP